MVLELSYFPGCSLHGTSKMYDITVKDVLSELGVKLAEIDDWSCCGATSAHKTDHRLGVALPARNLGIAQKAGRPVVAPCSSCYSRLNAANAAMTEEPDLLDSINADLESPYTERVEIRNILEVIIEGLNGEDAPQIVNPLKGLDVVCYYGCLLTRTPGHSPRDDVENPTQMDIIMRKIGANAIDWSYKTDCCGASSTVPDRATSISLIKRLLDEARDSGAKAIVTSCSMCQLNLDMCQEEAGAKESLPIYFITELVGIALGLKAKMGKEIRHHFIEGVAPLKDMGLL